jgi:hypothetical protein
MRDPWLFVLPNLPIAAPLEADQRYRSLLHRINIARNLMAAPGASCGAHSGLEPVARGLPQLTVHYRKVLSSVETPLSPKIAWYLRIGLAAPVLVSSTALCAYWHRTLRATSDANGARQSGQAR